MDEETKESLRLFLDLIKSEKCDCPGSDIVSRGCPEHDISAPGHKIYQQLKERLGS